MNWFLKGILFVGLSILLTRLIELQVIKGSYYRSLANDNRIRSIKIVAPRGRILARGGEVLAENIDHPKKISDATVSEWQRSYPIASVSAQITGYMADASSEIVGKVDPNCPDKGVKTLGTLVGQNGIEEQYDCILRGIDGELLVEVDPMGKPIRVIGEKDAVPGSDIQTTIDYDLQKKTAEAMNGVIGAAVITDAKGQVLSLFSSPSFDPNLFITPKNNSGKIASLLVDKSLPLFNRAITGAYHPGSTFKLIVGTAALTDAAISADTKFKDTGVLSVNGFDYSSWYFTQYGKVEGEQTFAQALSRSTDTFFYQIGAQEGIDRLVYWADQFGVGKKSGIDIPGESSGILPSPAWKLTTLGDRWYLGNTYHFSIGQGDLLTTPLQANLWTSVFANGGYYCHPYLALTKETQNCTKLQIPTGVISEVKKGMDMACATGGTAYPFFDFKPAVACKTGTAETGNRDKTHAWFTVMAPADNPEIVVTILVENGGEGSVVAAPIAKNILNYWFNQRGN